MAFSGRRRRPAVRAGVGRRGMSPHCSLHASVACLLRGGATTVTIVHPAIVSVGSRWRIGFLGFFF